MTSDKSVATFATADLLGELGWQSRNDAQWHSLDAAIRDGRLATAIAFDLELTKACGPGGQPND